MNNVSLVGRPTKDPELRYRSDGTAVCYFTLAVDRDFKTREGKREADFIQVKVWNKLGEITANYVDKGKLISVVGRIETESYTGKDGYRKYSTTVIADNINFLGRKKNTEGADSEYKESSADVKDGDGFTNVEGEVDNPFMGETPVEG